MLRIFLPLSVFLVFAGVLFSCVPAVSQELIAPDYFPMAVGNQWTYQIREINQSLTISITGAETDEGRFFYRSAAERSDGQKFSIEFIEKTGDNVLSLGSESLKSGKRRFFNSPTILLKFPLVPGNSWVSRQPEAWKGFTSTTTVISQENVQVPAGIFYAMYVVEESRKDDQVVKVHRWFAPGVGLVKWIIEARGQKVHFFLTGYSLK